MKRFYTLIVVCAAMVMAAGCTSRAKAPVKSAAGNDYQVMVIVDDEYWKGELAAAVCDMFEEDAPGLTRPQGYFDIEYQVSRQRATDIDKKYGNLFVVSINPAVVEATMTVSYNVYARPQTVVTVTAPDAASAAQYITAEADALREIFEAGERAKSNKYYAARPAEQLMSDFKDNTGFDMLIPEGYFKATTRDKSLLWYLRDYKDKAQYIFAYSYPMTDAEDLSPRWIMMSLDNKLSTITSKGAAGSYMGVNESGPVVSRDVEIGGRTWLELRGWWEVNNDFMGGPFVSYTTLDESVNELTTIMFALYAPEDPQRNLLREMEHLIYTIK